jgi:hypothetical protein
MTFSTFASIPDILDSDDFTIATASGGSLTANTYYFWLQLHNWSGRNVFTSLGSVTVTLNQKIIVTLKPTLRRDGEDFNFAILSVATTNNPAIAIQIARWENKEEEISPLDNKKALATDTYSSFLTDKTIELTLDNQLIYPSNGVISTFASLPTTNVLNGSVRYVTADVKHYRYKANTNQWVYQESYNFNPYISDSTLEGGCNRKLSGLTNAIASKIKTTTDSIKQRFWFINGYTDDGQSEVKTSNNISLRMFVNGVLIDSNNQSYTAYFSGLIKTKLLGFYNFSDRSLNTSLTGVGELKTFDIGSSSLKLPEDLPPGEAAVYEIYYSFDDGNVIKFLPKNSTIGLDIYNYGVTPKSSDLSLITGDFIVNTGELLRLIPDVIGVKRLSGISVIKGFSSDYTTEENYSFGMQFDTDDQLATISASTANEIRLVQSETELKTTETIRAYVGTVDGESALSPVSNAITVSANARITVAIDLPSDGTNATIRSNYPDPAIAGNDKAILNAPKLSLYLSNGSTVYKHENVVNCNNVDTLSFFIDTLGTEVFTLPSAPDNDYCLFDFPDAPVIAESVGNGDIPVGSYTVYLVYSYPSPNIFPTRIRHDLVNCIPEIQTTLVELLANSIKRRSPVEDIVELRALSSEELVDGHDRYVKSINSYYSYDTNDISTDNGISIVEPVNGNGAFKIIARGVFENTSNPTATNDITEGYLVGDRWINTVNDSIYFCVDNTEDNAVWSSGGGSINDGDKGDITVSNSGITWTIDNNAVSYAKIQDVSATDKLLGRVSSGSGDIEEITCTSYARTLLDDTNASTARSTLELGTLATQSGTFSGTSSGTNTGDQNTFSTIAISGQDNVVADSNSDTLTLVAGGNIVLTTDETTDSITIAFSGTGGSFASSDISTQALVTVASDDNLVITDTSDSGNLKRIVASDLIDLSTDTSPELSGNLNVNSYSVIDVNSNELIKFGVTSSAVNEITVTNHSTGNNPKISATGNDTNVGLTIEGKGTGIITFNSPVYFAKPQDMIISDLGDSVTIDLSVSNIFKRNAVAGDITFSVSNITTNYHIFSLYFTYTSGAITWFSGITWDGGTAPTLTTTKVYEFTFKTYDGGTNWLGMISFTNAS